MFGVTQDFWLGGVLFRPLPFLLQFLGELVGVLQTRYVASGAGLAIPIPGTANTSTTFEHLGRESRLPCAMQHVQAGKTRADDCNVHGVSVRSHESIVADEG